MIRRVIEIDEERCDGCGLCASACHEGAIEVIDGKARLVRDDYCDGLGDCLPACPRDAISFVEREAAAYDQAAVELNKQQKANAAGSSCQVAPANPEGSQNCTANDRSTGAVSQLRNWPVQIKLAPTKAAYFDGADLLIAADCCAYSFAPFHERFMSGRICVIGCSKLDGTDYTDKLAAIIANNDIASITVCRMEVPCCGGLERMASAALVASGKRLPWQVVTFSLDGRILD